MDQTPASRKPANDHRRGRDPIFTLHATLHKKLNKITPRYLLAGGTTPFMRAYSTSCPY